MRRLIERLLDLLRELGTDDAPRVVPVPIPVPARRIR